MASLDLDPDRLLPTDPTVRSIARRIYSAIADLPIVSPHGHVDPALLLHDDPFIDPAALFVTPDHYVTRLLHAHGVPLDQLGLGDQPADPRTVWRTFCEHWWAFRATPSRSWLEAELADVLGISDQPSGANADALFDEIVGRLAQPSMRPRALFERFRIDLLATTDDPCSDLSVHQALRADSSWAGRIIPTFRPDRYLDVGAAGWTEHVDRLASVTGIDTSDLGGFLAALESRRTFFGEQGATAADYGPVDAVSVRLEAPAAGRTYAEARAGTATTDDLMRLRQHLLWELARMSSEDGLVMQLHPGVLRNHHEATWAAFGSDTGHDIPVRMEFTRALRPILQDFGTN